MSEPQTPQAPTMPPDEGFDRQGLCTWMSWAPATLDQYLSRTRRAVRDHYDVTRRPYRWLPLPDETDHWSREVIAAYEEDAPYRAERRRNRTRGPAGRIVTLAGIEHMAVQVEHRITREQLRWALWSWRIHNKAVPLPTARPGLLAVAKASLEEWGVVNTRARALSALPEIDAAVEILWPKEAPDAQPQ